MNSSMNKWSEEECEAIVARIRLNYDYDSDRGMLISRRTGKAVTGSHCSLRNGICRYRKIDLKVNDRMFPVIYHHAVWAWHHGRLPTMGLDHINHDTFDNHVENLREVTQTENLLNVAQPWQSGSGGLPGVTYDSGSYRMNFKHRTYSSRDPYHLFYLLTLLGRRFK